MELDHELLPDVIRTWGAFGERCLPANAIALIYHADLDGALSAAVLQLALVERRAATTIALHSVATDEYDFASLMGWLRSSRPSVAISLDLSIENNDSAMECLHGTSECGVFVFDHHSSDRMLHGPPFPDSVVVVNPTPRKQVNGTKAFPSFLFGRAVLQSTSYSVPDWLLLLAIFVEGVDGDFSTETDALLKRCFPQARTTGSLRDRYRATALPRLSSLLRAALSANAKEHLVVALLREIVQSHMSLRSASALLESHFAKLASTISDSISEQVERHARLLAQLDPQSPRLVSIEVPASASMTAGPVASILRGAFPDRVIVTWYARNGRAVLELRTSASASIDLPRVLKEANDHISLLSFGGHSNAAGAMVDERKLEALLSWLRDQWAQDGR
jgi:single-stranded DNA-specific DHH superfamily exonuclease